MKKLKSDCKLCGGRTFRTTKNYKPAKKCHECGDVKTIEELKHTASYRLEIEHNLDGLADYDYELFERSLPFLIITANKLFSLGIIPRRGDTIWGGDEGGNYWIKRVIFYDDSYRLMVDEKRNKKLDKIIFNS